MVDNLTEYLTILLENSITLIIFIKGVSSIFWIGMLINSIRTKKKLWTIFLTFGFFTVIFEGIFATIYFITNYTDEEGNPKKNIFFTLLLFFYIVLIMFTLLKIILIFATQKYRLY